MLPCCAEESHMDNITLNNLSPELRKHFDDKFSALSDKIEQLEYQLAELQDKAQKKRKKDFTAFINLEEMKLAFLETQPENRTEPMNNWELVFWASYVLSRTERREKLDSLAEVAKRSSKIRAIVQYVIDNLKLENIEDLQVEDKARLVVKDYLEFVLTTNKTLKTKDGDVPFTYWIAVSDWAVNNFMPRLAAWRQSRYIEDKPA